MTITDFNTLTLHEQLEFLYAEGIYLSKRMKGKETVVLLQLNQLYVEIFYRKYRQEVNLIRCANTMEVLSPYLENMIIDDIFS
jgi:hypothetical protein